MLKFKKLISLLLVVLFVAALLVVNVSAESVNLVTSTQSPTLNSEFNVAVKFTGSKLGSIDAVIKYDANRLKCTGLPADTSNPNAGEILISHYNANGFSDKIFEIKFRAIAEGTAKIEVVSSEVWSADNATKYTPLSSTSVNVIDKSKLSGNANLKSMILSDDIPLNPAFDKNITTYNIEVDNSVEKVLINAVQEDAEAKISYGGSTVMKVGPNKRWVTVTAPNGTQKVYTININRAVPPEDSTDPTLNPYAVEIDGEYWFLAKEYTDDIKLADFSPSSAMVEGVELPMLKSNITQEFVVFAKTADESKSGYFSYNDLTGKFSVYRIYEAETNHYVLLDIENNIVLPKGYYKTNANVGGYDISVIKYEDVTFADFLIVYAQAHDGNKDYYRVDTLDGSIQRLPEFKTALKNAGTMTNGTIVTKFIAMSNMEKFMVVSAVLAILLSVALIVIIIARLIRAKKIKDAQELNEFDELEEFADLNIEDEEENEEDSEEYEDEEYKDEEDF